MSLTNWAIPDSGDLRSEPLLAAPSASLDGPGRVPSPISNGRYGITSDVLSIGSRVCVPGRFGTCGRVVRLMPMTGRVVVRLDHLTQTGAAPCAAFPRSASSFAPSSRRRRAISEWDDVDWRARLC
jgi:hypothetical protein